MNATAFALILIAVAAALSAIMAVAWRIWSLTRNSGWVDATWTFGVGAVGAAGALAPYGELNLRRIVVALLIVLWSLRLGCHIARRTAAIKDDPRYAKLLEQWGKEAPRQMFCLLQKQALVSIPLALSMILAAWNPLPVLRIQDLVGALLLVVGIAGEDLADSQLRRFKCDPANRGRICDVGLWSWSRHPNYF